MIEFSGIVGMCGINGSRSNVSQTDVHVVAVNHGSKIDITKKHGIFEAATQEFAKGIGQLLGRLPASDFIPGIDDSTV